MFRSASIALAALVAAGAASAAGPGWSTTQSIASPDGRLIYETDAQRGHTTVDILRGARRTRTVRLKGLFGVPVPTNQAQGEGLSHDGRTFILASAGGIARFAVLNAHTLRVRRMIRLRGQFTYDALSPTASTLYLIQHLPSSSVDHYYVRAYDLRAGHLLKQIVFDRREKGEAMTGWAIARATGPSGRWVYTLYGRSNGTLFVHALDTLERHAVCIDLPPRVGTRNMYGVELHLRRGALVARTATKRVAVIDTKTLRLRT